MMGALAVFVALIAYVILRPSRAMVDRVRQEPVVLALALTGRAAPRLEAELRSLVPGRLVSLTKEEGETVSEGEILGRVEVEVSRAELQRAQASRAAQAARVEQLERELERARELHRREVIPLQELEDAELRIDVAREELRSLTKLVNQTRERLEDNLLIAPFDGIVLRRPVDPGHVVGAQSLVYRVGTLEDRRVEVEVDERHLAALAPGMPAVAAPIGSDERLAARIVFVGDDVDPVSGTALVRLAFDAPAVEIPSGLSVDVNIVVKEIDLALTVARQAVLDVGGTERVLLVDGRKLREQPVEVIDWQAERVVILRGLRVGDRVVVNPREYAPGQSVRPMDVERG
jgi:RND family efflux transporter MFP subunit